MVTTATAETRTAAIAGTGVRHDAELRATILGKNPDWQEVLRVMCSLENEGLLMVDTIGLFIGRCPDANLTMQIQSMVEARPPVLRRAI